MARKPADALVIARRRPANALVKHAALDFLLDTSKVSLGNIQLQAGSKASNARKELLALLDEWVSESAFAFFTAWLQKHQDELLRPAASEPLPTRECDERNAARSLAADVMGESDPLEPFFQPRAVSAAILGKQRVSHRHKWPRYYASFGCLVCKSKQKPHDRCGMCGTCYRRTWERLRAILKELEQER